MGVGVSKLFSVLDIVRDTFLLTYELTGAQATAS